MFNLDEILGMKDDDTTKKLELLITQLSKIDLIELKYEKILLFKTVYRILLEIKSETDPLIDNIITETNNFSSVIRKLNSIMKTNPKIQKKKIYPLFKKLS